MSRFLDNVILFQAILSQRSQQKQSIKLRFGIKTNLQYTNEHKVIKNVDNLVENMI